MAYSKVLTQLNSMTVYNHFIPKTIHLIPRKTPTYLDRWRQWKFIAPWVFIAYFAFAWSFIASGQSSLNVPVSIHWNTRTSAKEIPSFPGVQHLTQHPGIPSWSYRFPLTKSMDLHATVSPIRHSLIDYPSDYTVNLPSKITPETSILQQGDQFYGEVTFPTLYKIGDQVYRLDSAQLSIKISAQRQSSTISYREDPKTKSELADGQVYKIAVNSYGVHVIDGAFLQSLGIQTAGLDPRNIRILGHPGGVLPERISTPRVDDLEELSIRVEGEDDGKWDSGDRILFYAEGPDKIELTQDGTEYTYTKNIYALQSYYYIKIDTKRGKRIQTATVPKQTDYVSNSYLNLQHFEEDKSNLLGRSRAHEGSGQLWVGEEFTNVRSRDYSDKFNTLHLNPSAEASIKMQFVARNSSTNKVILDVDGQSFEKRISNINITSVESLYARIITINEHFTPKDMKVKVTYPTSPNVSSGWINYISINHEKRYNYANENQIRLYDPATLAYNSASYTMAETPSGYTVWDISDPLAPILLPTQEESGGQKTSFVLNKSVWQHLAFNKDAGLLKPEPVGAVAQQNLHGLKDIDELIVYFADIKEAAEKLAQHRERYSNLRVALVDIAQVYNEFSAGKPDPTGLRDFIRVLYKHSKSLQYVLLFGDGSYDARGIHKDVPRENYLPIYETKESLNPITAFPSDDYFGLISDNEGNNLNGLLDVSVGRIPARNNEDALRFVDRIIAYETDPETFKDWKNRFLVTADDEDSNRHLIDIENICRIIQSKDPNYNINKIYLDAYEQFNTSGGQRYPQVTKSINQSIFKGVFAYTYLGHGGPTGLAQERILQINDILQWNNKEKTPIFITATCSFTPFDDPSFVSVGEQTIFHPTGGVSALLSTVRAVFANSNYQLTSYIIGEITKDHHGQRPKIGKLFTDSKNNNSGSSANSQKFFLFGDPAMNLMVPTYQVRTTKINGIDAQDFKDTLRALEQVSIEGIIQDHEGKPIPDFTGKLYVTLFDKPGTLRTRANDAGSNIATFELQNSVLYKGLVSIKQGKFKLSFILPKELNFRIGPGKLSYYATDEQDREARGYKNDVLIGGGGDGKIVDDTPPEIKLYINDLKFVNGGIAGTSPVLLVKLKDDYGINFSGSSIGHDITARLDQSEEKLILNEQFEPTLDNSKEGQIKYPLSELEPGAHTIKVTAWDIANNSAAATLDFVVIDGSDPTLKHVLNFPNPFTTLTAFQFEHNQSDADLDVMIQIFTVRGSLVKTIETRAISSGYRVDDIIWDGRDDFGNKLARGVYLYKIYVKANHVGEPSSQLESPLSKLVILK